MKEKGAAGEDHKRTRAEEDAISRRVAIVGAALSEIARPVVIDRAGRNHQHRRAGQRREHRNHQEVDALREQISHAARHERDRDIAAMVESRIAAEAARQHIFRHQAERQRRHRRNEGVSGERQNARCERHRPEGRHGENDEGGERHRGHGRDDDRALGAGHVDGGADRGLQRDAEQTAARRHQPDVGLGPVLASDEKDIDERSEKIPDVG